MSAAKLVLSVLSIPPARTFMVETGKLLLANLLDTRPPARHTDHSCPRCGWSEEHRSESGLHPSGTLLNRVRLVAPGLRGHPERVAEVEASLARLAGVTSAQASYLTGRILVLFDSTVVDLPTIQRTLVECPPYAPASSLPAELVGADR